MAGRSSSSNQTSGGKSSRTAGRPIANLAIMSLAISVNLVADWILTRTSSLKGGRGG